MEKNFGNFFWDTTESPINFPKKIKEKFFNLNIKKRVNFTEWIGKVSKKYSDDIDWWLKIPATRDPFISDLYKNILIIEILKDKNISKDIKFLTVESKALYQTITKSKVLDIKKVILKNKKKRFFSLIKYFIFSMVIFFSIKIFSKKKFLNPLKKIILVDTLSDYRFSQKDLVYPGLYETLKKKRINKLYFVPNFFPSKNIINIIRNINYFSLKNYIFKENYLNLLNYIECIKETLSKKLINNSIKFNDTDMSMIINEELNSKKHFYSEFLARVNLKFIQKLKEDGLDIKKAVNRFENQPMDKAWNYAFRSYFPKADVIGYQGYFYYPHFPHQSPTVYENKANVVPKKIIITGKAFKKPRQEFYSKTKIVIGPSLGKQNFLEKIKKNYVYKFVLALCGVKSLDEKMLQWSLSVLSKNSDLNIVIKPHPILSVDSIIDRYSKNIKDRIIISQENVNKLLEKSEVVISSGPTSIILESLVYGCKLLYLILDPNDTLITKKIPKCKNYLTFISDENDLLKQMVKLNKKRYIKKNNNLSNDFFTKKNDRNIKLFI